MWTSEVWCCSKSVLEYMYCKRWKEEQQQQKKKRKKKKGEEEKGGVGDGVNIQLPVSLHTPAQCKVVKFICIILNLLLEKEAAVKQRKRRRRKRRRRERKKNERKMNHQKGKKKA